MSPNRAVAALEAQQSRRIDAERSQLVYEPYLVALGSVAFVDRTRGVNDSQAVGKLVSQNALGAIVRWNQADSVDLAPDKLDSKPEAQALFTEVSADLNSPSDIKAYAKDFADFLYHDMHLDLPYHPRLKLYGKSGESERDFKVRVQQAAREQRDAQVDKLKSKYGAQIDRLETRLKREKQELDQDQAEYGARKQEELLSGAQAVASIFGILGRRSTSGVMRTMTKRRLSSQAKADIEESEQEIARLQKDIKELNDSLQSEIDAITQDWDKVIDEIETYQVTPRRADVRVDLVALAWVPTWEIHYNAGGHPTSDSMPAWK